MKVEVQKRTDKLKMQDMKFREMPDIVVKVHCKYRAELFFKISRKTKLSRLFNAWTERMEANEKKGDAKSQSSGGSTTAGPQVNGTSSSSSSLSASAMQFIFSHGGRTLEVDQTPEEAGMEDGDEILAVEIMDLTEGPGTEELVCSSHSFHRVCLKLIFFCRMRVVSLVGNCSRNIGRRIRWSKHSVA